MSIWKGLTTLVTGGLGALGSAVVKNVIRGGGRVVILDLPEVASATFVEKLNSKFSDSAMLIEGNVKSEEDIKMAIDKTKNTFGPINVCVSCAGNYRAYQIINPNKEVPSDFEGIESVINVNLIGTFNVNRLVAAHMAQNEPNENGERGVLVNTSGFCDTDAWKAQFLLGAACGGISGMTLPMSRDLASLGIRICTISPGLFMNSNLRKLPPKVKYFFNSLACHPQRFGEGSEYAQLVEEIVRNPMLNGTTIKLDAGFRMSVS